MAMRSVGPRSPRRTWPCSTGAREPDGALPRCNRGDLERVTDRIHRLALTQAISQLNGVDRRRLALF
jgi:hypothetical protein